MQEKERSRKKTCQTIWENNKTPAGSRLAGVRCRGVHSQCVAFICTNLTLPTGALDSRAADGLLKILGRINSEGQTILMVTHSVKAASHAGRVLFIKDGEVFHQIYRGGKNSEELYQNIADTLTVIATGGERR